VGGLFLAVPRPAGPGSTMPHAPSHPSALLVGAPLFAALALLGPRGEVARALDGPAPAAEAPVQQDEEPTDDGVVVESWPDGSPRRVYEVDEEGRRDGDFTEYRIGGELLIEASYRDGLLHGRYRSYHENGEVELDCTYKKGLLDGRYRTFDREGERLVEGAYDEGRKDGRFEIRREGEVVSKQKWSAGVLVDIDGFADPFPRPLATIAEELAAIRATVIEPVLSSSYEGDIDPELAEGRVLALKRLMEYRALSGLRYADMELDDKKNWHCTAAAKLLNIIGRLDHTPKNPGMPEDEYKTAYTGTSSSNLAMGSSLPGSIDSYMDDSDPSNIDRVGHRRWCLNPKMKETGFGIEGRFSAMWSFDESGSAGKWDHVCYPAPGFYPVSHFDDHHAWSVRFPGGVLGDAQPSDLVIEVFALDADYARGLAMDLDHVSISGGQVVFRPEGLACAEGRAYEVRIGKAGKRGPDPLLRYFVEFADVEALLAPPEDQTDEADDDALGES